jgi:HAD superfamily hydrolase (TIGR01484 family)
MKGEGNVKDIKMIIFDLDGTLLNNEGVLSKRTISVLKEVKEKGYLFGFASGRMESSAENVLHKGGLDKSFIDVIVSLNDGLVEDYQLYKEESFYQIDGSLIKEVVVHFEDYPVNFGIQEGKYLVAMKNDALAWELAKADDIPYTIRNFEDIYVNKQRKLVVIYNPEDME